MPRDRDVSRIHPESTEIPLAARAAARLKPVVAIKAGRHVEAAKAAATHTGALSGADRVVDAALRRAGVLRIDGLAELFDAVETIGRFSPLKRAQVAIVTNGGGAGVLAVDRLMDLGCVLAELGPATIRSLDAVLPGTWSRANPVDIIGDAPPERYRLAIEAVAADPAVDVLIIMNCPTGLASPVDAAHAVASAASSGLISGKPALTCWLGGQAAREGRQVLAAAGLTSFDTPSDVAMAMSYLSNWSDAQRALARVPNGVSGNVVRDRQAALVIFRNVAGQGRRMLTEPEAKAVIAAYGIPVPETVVVDAGDMVEQAAARLLERSAKVAVKLLSKTLTHKSDVGGVALDIETAAAARLAVDEISRNLKQLGLEAAVDGFTLQPMIERKGAHELILGIHRDPIFGPVILFGAGGVSVEVVNDTAIALPPLDDLLAADVIDRTRVGRQLAGYRDRPPADRTALVSSLNAISQMIVDFSCIVAIDINPLLADDRGVIALDARIEIDPAAVECPSPNPNLAIRPYPAEWEKEFLIQGKDYRLRPIRPADISLYPSFLEKVSADDIRLRFLAPRKSFPDQMLIRLTQIDYEREMAFVALDGNSGELAGIARLYADPDHEIAEYGLLVRTDLQGHGIGWALLAHLRDFAMADGLRRIEGIMLSENQEMLKMCREFGFVVERYKQDPRLFLASLDLRRSS